MIVQVNGDNQYVSLTGNVLAIQPFAFDGVNIPLLEKDLTELQVHEPKTVRFYAGLDGQYHESAKQPEDAYWLVAEATLPPIRYESVGTGQVDEHGQDIMEIRVALPDLENEMDVKAWALPPQQS